VSRVHTYVGNVGCDNVAQIWTCWETVVSRPHLGNQEISSEISNISVDLVLRVVFNLLISLLALKDIRSSVGSNVLLTN
jgi:hypothetical protein